MKQISYNELPEIFTDEIMNILMEMERLQTQEWHELYDRMSFDEKNQYYELKKQRKKAVQHVEGDGTAPENEDNKFREFWIRYVNVDRHYADITLEEELELVKDETFYTPEKLSELFDQKIVNRILFRRRHLGVNERFTFFWATKSPFSQWHTSHFSASTFMAASTKEAAEKLLAGAFPVGEQQYSSAEQFMMYHKAMLFLDRDTARQIMDNDNVREIKALGRQVKNFDEEVWRYHRSKIVYEGNKAKFAQNEDLKAALRATSMTTLVEAAPNDSLWGIGLAENDSRAQRRETWLGKNLLGEILTQIRIELMGDY